MINYTVTQPISIKGTAILQVNQTQNLKIWLSAAKFNAVESFRMFLSISLFLHSQQHSLIPYIGTTNKALYSLAALPPHLSAFQNIWHTIANAILQKSWFYPPALTPARKCKCNNTINIY